MLNLQPCFEIFSSISDFFYMGICHFVYKIHDLKFKKKLEIKNETIFINLTPNANASLFFSRMLTKR